MNIKQYLDMKHINEESIIIAVCPICSAILVCGYAIREYDKNKTNFCYGNKIKHSYDTYDRPIRNSSGVTIGKENSHSKVKMNLITVSREAYMAMKKKLIYEL